MYTSDNIIVSQNNYFVFPCNIIWNLADKNDCLLQGCNLATLNTVFKTHFDVSKKLISLIQDCETFCNLAK